MPDKVFNTSFEISLRLLLLLREFGEPESLDRIFAGDFITTYGKDFGVSSYNLNGDNNYLFSEFVSRREIVKNALKDGALQNYFRLVNGRQGILYGISEEGKSLAEKLQSEYANEYKTIARGTVMAIKNKDDHAVLLEINRILSSTLEGASAT